VPDDSETCPRCGAIVPRGLLSSLRGLFGGGKAKGPATPAPASPSREKGESFRFGVEDVFSISGRGTIVTGRVASGSVRVGDEVRFESAKGAAIRCRVVSLEALGGLKDEAKAGDSVGLLLSSVKLQDIAVGTTIEGA
jgi:translation elongation factor EF-Tu-like GTPase